jgi:hypothetical protein
VLLSIIGITLASLAGGILKEWVPVLYPKPPVATDKPKATEMPEPGSWIRRQTVNPAK